MTRSWLAGLAVALAAGHVAAAEWTDDREAPGRAASVSYRAMAAGAPIAVRPLDDSPLNLTVAAELAQALSARGLTVSEDAPLVLEFETATESTVTPPPPRGSTAPPRRVDIGRKRDLGRGDSINAHVDVYSTSRSSLLTGVRTPGKGLRYSLKATLSEPAGARLWEGYTAYGAIAGDDERIFVAMAPLLAAMVGATTGERRFRAD